MFLLIFGRSPFSNFWKCFEDTMDYMTVRQSHIFEFQKLAWYLKNANWSILHSVGGRIIEPTTIFSGLRLVLLCNGLLPRRHRVCHRRTHPNSILSFLRMSLSILRIPITPQRNFTVVECVRRANNVVSIENRLTILRWIVGEVERAKSEKQLNSKTICQFPQFFCSGQSANIMSATHLWKEGDALLSSHQSSGARWLTVISVFYITQYGKKRIRKEGRVAKGQKCASSVVSFENPLVMEFDQLRKMGMKISTNNLMLCTTSLVLLCGNPLYNRDMEFGLERKQILEQIVGFWMQRFMNRCTIVLHQRAGKLQMSFKAQKRIKRRIVYFKGNIARQCLWGELSEDNI